MHDAAHVRPDRLHRGNLYMLPTRHGVVFAFMLLAMLLIAVNYANTLAYIMTFLLVSLVLVSMIYTHRNLAGIEVSAGRCRKVFAGHTLHYQVCLQNHARRARHDIAIDIAGRQGQRLNLEAGQLICLPCEMQTSRRGWLTLPAVQVNTRYPLGLMFSWSRAYQPEQKCLVYPRPGPNLPFPSGSGEGVVTDSNPARQHGQDDFAGLRDYREGDAMQHIDWKSYARGMGLHTKLFVTGQSPELIFSWSDLQGDAEARISLLTRWVIEAERLGARFSLLLPGERIASGSGQRHMENCLKALALI